MAKPFSGVRPGNQILEALRYFDVWQGQKTQISSSQSVSEDRPGNRFFSNQNYCRHRLKLFEIVRKKSISPRVVWTLVVQIKKTQESTPIIIKRITEDKENIILLPSLLPSRRVAETYFPGGLSENLFFLDRNFWTEKKLSNLFSNPPEKYVSGKYVSGRLEVEKNKNAFLEGVKKNRVPL